MSSEKVGELREIPGPRTSEWLERAQKVSATTVQNSLGLVLDSMAFFRGLIMRDPDGNEYFDWFSGAGVNNLGHGDADVSQALVRQIHRGGTQYDWSVFPHTRGIVLMERLTEAAPGSQARKIFLSNSGTEAVEAALKLVMSKRPERKRFIAFEGAFHGRTGYALPLNGSQAVHKRYFPQAYPVHHFPFPSEEGALDPLFQVAGTGVLSFEDINAVIIELIQGEGGVRVANKAEMKRLISWCNRHHIYLIVDEVQTGMGRTGRLFACEHYGINPDIIILAKALTNGASAAGATIFNADLDFEENGRHANTNGGNYLAVAAAIAVLDRIEGDSRFLENVRHQELYLMRQLHDISVKFNFSADRHEGMPRMSKPRGRGLMQALDICYPDSRDEFGANLPRASQARNRVVDECFRRGLIVEGTGVSGIRFLPPLIIQREDTDLALRIFCDALRASFDTFISYSPV